MTESDDSLFGGGDTGGDIPVRAAENIKRTATQEPQLSEQARKTRRRRAAGVGADFGRLQLSTPGLLGIPEF